MAKEIKYEFTSYFEDSDFEKMSDPEFAYYEYLSQLCEPADIAVYNARLGEMPVVDAIDTVTEIINDLLKRKEDETDWIADKWYSRVMDAAKRLESFAGIQFEIEDA